MVIMVPDAAQVPQADYNISPLSFLEAG
jgi:hypothetical protein